MTVQGSSSSMGSITDSFELISLKREEKDILFVDDGPIERKIAEKFLTHISMQYKYAYHSSRC